MERLYRKGIGSLAYRDQWNLFDQIFLTANLVNPEEGQYRFWKAGIFNPPYLVTKKGRIKAICSALMPEGTIWAGTAIIFQYMCI